MSVLRDKTGHANIRHVILTFIILSGLAAAFLYYPPIPTRTAEELTQGDITFTDSAAKEWGRLKTRVDTKDNIITASVDSLSIFAVSARRPGQIDIRDTRSNQVRSDFKTYDDARNLKKSGRS
ncbi:MAG: hypothetical protein KKD46_06890, partial [Euryarchaeota archaeon]|nr:hypothetical protein [Euryarchaeota archaeon]MBU4340624.1 hypothetical protein [Euryarchaeota archaeon]MBU4453865.1 hypothetical protein [Euryarchaeota archaeon]